MSNRVKKWLDASEPGPSEVDEGWRQLEARLRKPFARGWAVAVGAAVATTCAMVWLLRSPPPPRPSDRATRIYVGRAELPEESAVEITVERLESP